MHPPAPQPPGPGDAAAPLAPFCHLTADAADAGQRVGDLVQRRLRLSRTLYRRIKARGGLWLNGAPARADTPVRPGDRITLALPAVAPAAPEAVHLSIVYEDEWLVVVDKPPGLVVHPARGHCGGTLVNGIVHHRLQRGEPPWVHLVHRLDRGTSGLMLVAKNPHVHELLAPHRPAGRARLGRSYVALVEGHVAPVSGVIAVPIQEPRDEPGVGPARAPSPGGRPSTTRFRRAWRGFIGQRPVTLVAVRLASGRTHQIRVHMAYLGHPVVGDALYGQGEVLPGRPWPALHARKLWLVHPMTERRFVFKSPVPFSPLSLNGYPAGPEPT